MKKRIIRLLLDIAIYLMDKPPVKHSSVIREYENKIEKEVRPWSNAFSITPRRRRGVTK